MHNEYIGELGLKLNELAYYQSLGLEGRSLTDYLSLFVNRWNKAKYSLFDGLALSAKAKPTVIPNRLAKRLKRAKQSDIAPVTVFKPIGFDNHITPYSLYIKEVVEQLVSVEERLYKPLIAHFSEKMSDPAQVDTAWINKSIQFINYDKTVKKLGSFSDARIKGGEGSTSAPFSELFISPQDFLVAGEVINEIISTTKGINITSLEASEKTLIELVNQFINTAKEHPEIITKNKQTLRKLADTLNAIAAETELLGSIIYMTWVLENSFEESIEKLNKVL